MKPWIGVDLDGTLAEYHGWPKDGSIGKPIPAMVERVKAWLAEGKDVRIFTARVWPLGTADEVEIEQVAADSEDLGTGGTRITRTARAMEAAVQLMQINSWCREHLGMVLPVTCIKDYGMVEFWDDRAVQVEINTGRRVDGK